MIVIIHKLYIIEISSIRSIFAIVQALIPIYNHKFSTLLHVYIIINMYEKFNYHMDVHLKVEGLHNYFRLFILNKKEIFKASIIIH